jgi:predicted lipid carrier protein YhbT
MSDPTAEFFDGLNRRGHEPLLEKVTGAVRFEIIRDGQIDRWEARIQRGDVLVLRDHRDVSCVVRADAALFDAIATGERNAMAAILRGSLAVEGDPELLVLFQRLFPGPPRSAGRQPVTNTGRRQS